MQQQALSAWIYVSKIISTFSLFRDGNTRLSSLWRRLSRVIDFAIDLSLVYSVSTMPKSTAMCLQHIQAIYRYLSCVRRKRDSHDRQTVVDRCRLFMTPFSLDDTNSDAAVCISVNDCFTIAPPSRELPVSFSTQRSLIDIFIALETSKRRFRSCFTPGKKCFIIKDCSYLSEEIRLEIVV